MQLLHVGNSEVDMVIRNVARHGFFLTSANTTIGCPQAVRDSIWVACWGIASLLAVVLVFCAQKAFTNIKSMRPGALWGCYAAVQLILISLSCSFIYITPISPASAAVCIVGRWQL